MPKVKRSVDSDPKKRSSKVRKTSPEEYDVATDLKKSFNENVENRFRHWEKVDKDLLGYEKVLETLKQLLQDTENTPENRPKLSDWRAEIEELENKIRRLKRNNNQIEYLYGVVNVMKDTESSTSKDEKSAKDTIRVNANGPLKPRIKVKGAIMRGI